MSATMKSMLSAQSPWQPMRPAGAQACAWCHARVCGCADGIPIVVRVWKHKNFEPGPFRLGAWQLPVNLTAIAWAIISTVRRSCHPLSLHWQALHAEGSPPSHLHPPGCFVSMWKPACKDISHVKARGDVLHGGAAAELVAACLTCGTMSSQHGQCDNNNYSTDTTNNNDELVNTNDYDN